MYCRDFKDLVDKIEDYLDENYNDEFDFQFVSDDLKKIENEYNRTHEDQYTIVFDIEEGLDVLPNNYIAFKIINDNTNNSLIKWGFDWSTDMNKLIFIPTCFSDKDKLKFLINLMKSIYPYSESYFKKYWKEYLDEDKKWLC